MNTLNKLHVFSAVFLVNNILFDKEISSNDLHMLYTITENEFMLAMHSSKCFCLHDERSGCKTTRDPFYNRGIGFVFLKKYHLNISDIEHYKSHHNFIQKYQSGLHLFSN